MDKDMYAGVNRLLFSQLFDGFLGGGVATSVQIRLRAPGNA
jgi:hypothetical protein